jgi:hypothetical protein
MEVNTTSTADPVNMYNYLNNFVLNPIVFIIILLVIISYFVFFSTLGNNQNEGFNMNSSDTKYSNWQHIFGILIVLIVIILVLVNAFQYFFSVNITAYLNNLFSPNPEVDILVDHTSGTNKTSNLVQPHSSEDSENDDLKSGSSIPEVLYRKQVFNIPGNEYTFDNAKALCKAYGADLATYQQIEDAYKNGGEWCNYGWSANQMALYPTQPNTYDNLQKIKGHEHDCGRPGINGGYIANPNVKFGINCFGNKPKINQEEEELMKIASPYPKTLQDIEFQKKVDYWKNKVDQVLISPFNYNTWGQV